MCGTITMAGWLAKAGKPAYTLVAEYTNGNGEKAITMMDSDGDYFCVYSEDGTERESFWLRGSNGEDQAALARLAMKSRGFTIVQPMTTETDTVTV